MVRDEPLLGTGAGSFEAHWFRERSVAFHARDAHNLYLETLAELGPVGLALLLATLALPLLALPAARRLRVRARRGGGVRRLPRARGRRLGLGGAGRDGAGDLLRRRSPRRRAAGRSGRWLTGRRRGLTRWRCWPRSPPSRSSRTSATAPPRRASPRPRPGDPARGARRGEASDPLGAVVGGSLAAARRGRARARRRRGSPQEPLRTRSSGIPRAGAPGSTSRRRAADASGEQALDRATALNPLSPEVDELRTNP